MFSLYIYISVSLVEVLIHNYYLSSISLFLLIFSIFFNEKCNDKTTRNTQIGIYDQEWLFHKSPSIFSCNLFFKSKTPDLFLQTLENYILSFSFPFFLWCSSFILSHFHFNPSSSWI
jgi:hypothetical protein